MNNGEEKMTEEIEEKKEPKFEAVKITNVHWLGVVGPFIKSFLDKEALHLKSYL